jgi:hypothetical protein
MSRFAIILVVPVPARIMVLLVLATLDQGHCRSRYVDACFDPSFDDVHLVHTSSPLTPTASTIPDASAARM